MNRVRRPPLQHPLALFFDRAVDSFCVALSHESIRQYRGTVRNFLSYLGADHPGVHRLDQLRREPHILGWMSRLHSQVPPLGTASYIIRLITLRPILNELAWIEQLPELAHLIRREDIPHAPQRLPRPLTAEQDQLLQQEFLRRNDLGGNVFLLMRHTGMRIGECADLSVDCLRSTGPNQWAIHETVGNPAQSATIRNPRAGIGRGLRNKVTSSNTSEKEDSKSVAGRGPIRFLAGEVVKLEKQALRLRPRRPPPSPSTSRHLTQNRVVSTILAPTG